MSDFSEFDLHCMQTALKLAETAKEKNEVPVGAVIANLQEEIIGNGYNCPISTNDPSAHAEIRAMRDAASKIKNYRLTDCTLYVTLEPCAMCAGAMLHARIKRLVFATVDQRAGAIMGAIDLFGAAAWNHSVKCEHGLLAEPCAEILRDFFKARR